MDGRRHNYDDHLLDISNCLVHVAIHIQQQQVQLRFFQVTYSTRSNWFTLVVENLKVALWSFIFHLNSQCRRKHIVSLGKILAWEVWYLFKGKWLSNTTLDSSLVANSGLEPFQSSFYRIHLPVLHRSSYQSFPCQILSHLRFSNLECDTCGPN